MKSTPYDNDLNLLESNISNTINSIEPLLNSLYTYTTQKFCEILVKYNKILKCDHEKNYIETIFYSKSMETVLSISTILEDSGFGTDAKIRIDDYEIEFNNTNEFNTLTSFINDINTLLNAVDLRCTAIHNYTLNEYIYELLINDEEVYNYISENYMKYLTPDIELSSFINF